MARIDINRDDADTLVVPSAILLDFESHWHL